MPAIHSRNFNGILSRFVASLLWSMGFGFLWGLIYRIGTPHLQQTLMSGISEFSSPIVFNAFGLVALFSLGFGVTAFGRSPDGLSSLRWFFCYQPAELILSISAVFFGLFIGFCLANLPNMGALEVLSLATFGLVFLVGSILVLLWASFAEARLPLSEPLVRVLALTACFVSASTLYLCYVQ